MDDRSSIWAAAARLAEQGAQAALATVSRRRGSLPMATDAKMVVTPSGERWGTVGGGCVEADVTGQALEVVARGEPAFVSHTLNADVAGDIGLSCGGTVEFFLEPVVATKEMARLYRGVAEAIEGRTPTVVYTAAEWGKQPRKAARIGHQVLTVGSPSLPSREESPAHGAAVSYFDESAGLFVEPVPRMPRVVIFGAGHVGIEIAKLAAGVGFHVMIVDDRREFADPQRIPWAHEVVAEDFRAVLDRLTLDEDDYVLATTRGHSFDAYIVERTAGSPARYVGMLGSRRKQAVIMRALEAAGVPPRHLKRVKTPIGVDIGADTPAEIAVSSVAELIRLRRLGETS